MQKGLKIIFTLLFLFGGLSGRGLQAAEVQDGILAVVNDDVITYSELVQFLNSHYTQLKLDGLPEKEIRQAMDELQKNGLNKIIEEKLILTEATKKGMTIRQEAIDKRISEIKGRYSSEQEFTTTLSASGATVTDLIKKITDQYKIKYLIDDEVRAKISVNPQEVTDYYTAHRQEFNKPERVELDSIYVSSAKNKEEAQKKIEATLNAIKSGKDFKEVAQQYSESPSIGTLEKGQMLPAVENVVFQLKKGEVSPPIEVTNGIYIFKLNNQAPAQIAPLEDVKKQINEIIYQAKFQDKYKEWVAKLKKKSFIEIKE